MIVWLNGELLHSDEARISPFDHGLLVGDGVFETVRSYAGAPFAMRRHLDRLEASASALGIQMPPRESLTGAATEVLRANALLDSRIRITVTGGEGPLGSARGLSGPTAIVAAAPLDTVTPTLEVAVSPWPRNERSSVAGAKTTSYAENVVALAWALERGAGEALFLNLEGHLCEGTGTNIFLVEGTRLVTPPLSAGCLAGVTRGLVLELAGEAGLDPVEENRPSEAVLAAEEAFLTSTTREIQAIAAVDGVRLPVAPGPATEKLRAAFHAMVERSPDP